MLSGTKTSTPSQINAANRWRRCARQTSHKDSSPHILRLGRGGARQEGGDGRSPISRYENGKIVLSTDMIVKLAEALDVSIDYLLVEGASRRSLKEIHNGRLADRMAKIEELPEEDQGMLLRIADALIAKNRLRSLAKEVGQLTLLPRVFLFPVTNLRVHFFRGGPVLIAYGLLGSCRADTLRTRR